MSRSFFDLISSSCQWRPCNSDEATNEPTNSTEQSQVRCAFSHFGSCVFRMANDVETCEWIRGKLLVSPFFFHSFAGQKLLSARARHALEFRLVDMAVLSIRYLWCEESLTPDSLINFVLFRRFFCAKFNLVLFVCFFFSSSTLWPVSSFIQLIGDLSELREKSYDDNGRAIASSCSSINSRQEVQSGNNQIFSLTKKKSKHDPWFPSNFNWKQMKSCKVYWVAESNLGLKSFIN